MKGTTVQTKDGRRYERPVASRLFPKLAEAMDARGMTLADLARAAGVTYQRLVVATSGYRAPSLDTQDRTAAALGMKPHELWQSESKKVATRKEPTKPAASSPAEPEPSPVALEDAIKEAQRRMRRYVIETLGDESVPLKVRAKVRAQLDKRGLEVRDGEIVAKHTPRRRLAPWQ